MNDQERHVQNLLDVFKAAGCVKARATFDGLNVASLEVEFAEGPTPATPFIDAAGRPVDLDAGAPDLAKDPDGPLVGEGEPSDDAIEQANFRRPRAS